MSISDFTKVNLEQLENLKENLKETAETIKSSFEAYKAQISTIRSYGYMRGMIEENLDKALTSILDIIKTYEEYSANLISKITGIKTKTEAVDKEQEVKEQNVYEVDPTTYSKKSDTEKTPAKQIANTEKPASDKQATNNEKNTDVEQPKKVSTPTNSGKYKQNSSFQVTTNNKTYQLSEKDIDFLAAVVESEGANNHNKDEALAVTSVILNRAETAGFANDPVSVCKQSGQFEGYYGGSYRKYLKSDGSYAGDPEVRQAVVDALNGTRNNDYLYFVADGYYMNKNSYNHYITSSGGNRYSKTF